MLFFVAAILYSSVHLLGVVGNTAVPAHEPVASHSTAAAIVEASADVTTRHETALLPSQDRASAAGETDVTLSAPVEGAPVRSSTLAACGAVHGRAGASTRSGDFPAQACLDELARASDSQVERFGASLHDSSAEDVDFATDLSEVDTADAISNWWSILTAPQRTRMISAMPGVVGNLEGVPYTTRDLANRVTLHRTITTLERSQASGRSGFFAAGADSRRLTMLQQVRIALDRGREGDDTARQLVSLDTVFPGRAAVSVGDLDTADDVSLMVPGMLYTVSNQITFWTDRAADLHSEQDFYANALATTTSKPTTSATVAWMGYRTPDLTNFFTLGLARLGAVHLEDTVDGLDAVRDGSMPRLNIIAHSYGSTTASIALSNGTIHADSFTVLGSPGSVVPRASELAVSPGGVFAAAAAFDPVAGSGFFGADPGTTSFGATLLDVAGGTDPFTEQHLSATFTHNTYFTPGSESVRNLALIGIGRSALAEGRTPDPEHPVEASEPTLAFLRPQDVYREGTTV